MTIYNRYEETAIDFENFLSEDSTSPYSWMVENYDPAHLATLTPTELVQHHIEGWMAAHDVDSLDDMDEVQREDYEAEVAAATKAMTEYIVNAVDWDEIKEIIIDRVEISDVSVIITLQHDGYYCEIDGQDSGPFESAEDAIEGAEDRIQFENEEDEGY